MSGVEPLVTVAMATYNRASTLRHALASVLAQDLRAIEVIVVGDACTDDSESVVRGCGDPRARWLNLPVNSGNQAEPNNAALREARGRFIAYLGHDDLWFPWHLTELVHAIDAKRVDFVHSLCALIGPDGVREAVGPPRRNVTYKQHVVPPSTWVHRREVVETCGPWRDPSTLPWTVDFDFSRRHYLSGGQLTFSPRLSVLKFPSPWFPGAYRQAAVEPQGTYLAEMRADPQRLERDVLLSLAIGYARQIRGGYERPEQAIRHALRAAAYWVADWWGRDRWPLSVVQHRRFRRQDAARRVFRGLSR